MERKITWELWKAIKYQVEKYSADHGYDVIRMFSVIKYGSEDDSKFWKTTCLQDYREMKEQENLFDFWFVKSILEEAGKRVWDCRHTEAVVSDKQAAKSISRYLRKHKKMDTYVTSEPTRYW